MMCGHHVPLGMPIQNTCDSRLERFILAHSGFHLWSTALGSLSPCAVAEGAWHCTVVPCTAGHERERRRDEGCSQARAQGPHTTPLAQRFTIPYLPGGPSLKLGLHHTSLGDILCPSYSTLNPKATFSEAEPCPHQSGLLRPSSKAEAQEPHLPHPVIVRVKWVHRQNIFFKCNKCLQFKIFFRYH